MIEIENEANSAKSYNFALIAIVILFIVCNIPRLMLNLAEWNLRANVNKVSFCETSKEISKLSFLISVNQICLIFNSSANVLIYYSASKMFKIKIKKLKRFVHEYFIIFACCFHFRYLNVDQSFKMEAIML